MMMVVFVGRAGSGKGDRAREEEEEEEEAQQMRSEGILAAGRVLVSRGFLCRAVKCLVGSVAARFSPLLSPLARSIKTSSVSFP